MSTPVLTAMMLLMLYPAKVRVVYATPGEATSPCWSASWLICILRSFMELVYPVSMSDGYALRGLNTASPRHGVRIGHAPAGSPAPAWSRSADALRRPFALPA